MLFLLLTILSLNLAIPVLGKFSTKTSKVCSTYYGTKSLKVVPSRTNTKKSSTTVKLTLTVSPSTTITPRAYTQTVSKYVTITTISTAPRKTDLFTTTIEFREISINTVTSTVISTVLQVSETTLPPGTTTFSTSSGFLPIQSDPANYPPDPPVEETTQQETTTMVTSITTRETTIPVMTTGDPEETTEEPDPVYTEYTETGFPDATTLDDGGDYPDPTDEPRLVDRQDKGNNDKSNGNGRGNGNGKTISTMNKVNGKPSSTGGRVNGKPSRTPSKGNGKPSSTPGKPSALRGKRYPASVLCESNIGAFTTSTYTTTARKTFTQTAETPTVSTTLTLRRTARATKTVPKTSSTIIKSATYTAAGLNVVLTTSTTTSTLTRAVPASSTISVFPACASDNYLSTYNGNRTINVFPKPTSDNAVSYVQVTGANTTEPVGCCRR
jgi:hypothetical protein